MFKSLTLNFINHEKEVKIDDMLYNFVKEIGQDKYFENFSYILKELAGNANKANLKRVHFERENLDITSPDDYEKGMENFRDYLSVYSDELFETAEEHGYTVEINLSKEENNFIISITNNTTLLPIEKTRIKDRMQKATQFKSMEEVFSGGLDTTEGGGFGIILVILMLRKIGLDEKTITIDHTEIDTNTRITFPLDLMDKSKGNIIADIIVKEIEEIPQFPQHIMTLMNMLNDPNKTFDEISKIIKKDPALIADLLKMANSTMYMLPKQVKSIEEAVRLIGISAIKNLVITYTSKKVLMNRYNLKIIDMIMKHSAEVSFYAYELAKAFNLKKILDDTYVCSMLHDFGKIIIQSLNPDIVEKIQTLCTERGINNFIVETLTNGYNHSILGACLAEKWNFPPFIIEAIKYHHIPLEADEKDQPRIFMIYMANSIYYYKRNSLTFEEINFQLLKYLNLTDKEKFDSFVKPIFAKFEERKE